MEQPNASVFYDSDFASSSFTEFEDMRKKGVLIDCKISVKNRCVKAHRLILAARIPLFRKLLITSARGVIKMEEEVDPDILESIINFAYTGYVEITPDNVRVLLLVSGYLQMTNVYDACWEFLEKSLCQDNVWQIRILANSHLRLTLVEVCDDYIKKNFEIFSQSEDFLGVPFSYLKEVTSQGNVEGSKEEYKLEAIIRWVEFSPSERNELLPELLQTVEVSRLTPEYLIEGVSLEKLVQTSLVCGKWLDEAKNYHLSLLLRQKPDCNNLTSQPTSRDQPTSRERPPLTNPDFGIYAVCSSDTKLLVKVMDSREKKWFTISQRHLVCVYHVFAIDQKIYVFCKHSTEILDVKTLEWHSFETDHGTLHSAALISVNDFVYSFGGEGNMSLLVRCFSLRRNEWMKESQMRKPRMFSGVTALNKNIYVTGGTFNTSKDSSFSAGNVYSDVEQYNTQTKTWKEVSPMLHRRYDHGCTTLNDKIYVCGGFSYTYLDSAEVYVPSTKKWSYILPMNAPKRLYSVISHDGKLYTLSKWPHSKSPVIDVNIYEPELNMWISELPIFRHYECNDAFLVCAVTPPEIDVTRTDEESDLNSGASDT